MAIVLDQEKKSVAVVPALITGVVVLTLVLGVYFFLFKRPNLVDVILPRGLGETQDAALIPFEPERVFQSEKFGALVEYGVRMSPPPAGRGNPFLP